MTATVGPFLHCQVSRAAVRTPSDPTGARDRNVEMVESDRAVIVRALADEDALRVFAQVVAVTGTGLPERSGDSLEHSLLTRESSADSTTTCDPGSFLLLSVCGTWLD